MADEMKGVWPPKEGAKVVAPWIGRQFERQEGRLKSI